MKSHLILRCLVNLLAAALSAAALAVERPPNVIYIMADDLGYGDLGCYGQEVIKTPNIDRLAAQGMRFTSFYAGNTVCRPSRLSLWTGKDMRNTPIQGNQAHAFQGDELIVANLAKGAGYATGGVGKWALYDETTGHPDQMGFDFWMGYLNQSEAHNYYPTRLWRNRKEVPLEGNVIADIDPKFKGRVAETRVTYSHDVMTDEAIDFIERQAGGPFLLHVHWTIPHANNEGGRATGDGMEVPNYGPYADRDWPTTEKGFAAMIARMDGDVGEIMDTLDRLDIAENTLIIFTSDNGPHNEGGHDHEYFDSNGPLRGYKRDLYEGGIRVPMIARWPKAIEAGAVSDYPSAFWDFLPTFCDVAGIEIPEGLDGRSIVPVFKGRQFEPNRALHWVFDMRKTTKRAVRWGKWKAVRPADDQPWELYDLERDIGEMTDLANEHPKVLDTVLATW